MVVLVAYVPGQRTLKTYTMGGKTQDRKWPCGTGWGMFWLLVDIVQGLAIALASDLVYAIC